MTIRFTVPCVPVAQPRQRHRIAGNYVINYTPGDHPVNAFKAAVQVAARQAYSGAPYEGPLKLEVCFVLPRPKKYCRKKDSPGRLLSAAKPDMDNLLKSLKDALNKLSWRDDSQIAYVSSLKQYAAKDEQPLVNVVIDKIEDVYRSLAWNAMTY